MKLFKLILLSSLMVLARSDCDTTNLMTNENIDSINKWTNVGVSFVQAFAKQDLESIVGVLVTLGEALPYIGPICSVLSGIISLFGQGNSEMDEFKSMLNTMNTKLNVMDEKLDELLKQLDNAQIVSNYKAHAEKMTNVYNAYTRYTGNPTEITKKDFVNECRDNSMLNFANWVEREINSETLQPIRKVMLENYDLKNFISWSKMLTSSMIQASFLHSVCLGITYQNEGELERTLKGPNGDNGDIHTFQILAQSLKNNLVNGQNELVANFFSKAKTEIYDYMRDNEKMSHEEFSQNLYTKVSDKYYWRSWLVASYSADTVGFDQHSMSDGTHTAYWIRTYDRCLFIGSTTDFYRTTSVEIENCVKEKESMKWAHSGVAKAIWDDMSTCIQNFDGLAVIKFGNNLRTMAGPGTGFFNTHKIYDESPFSIMVIPNDK